MRARGLYRSLSDFKRHPWLHAVTILTIAASLILLGLFFLCYRNVERLADKTQSQNTGTVYLKDAIAQDRINRIKDEILSLPGVRNIHFKTRQSVMDELQTFLGSQPGENFPGTELFPDVLEVEYKKDASSLELGDLKAMIGKIPEVSEVDFSDEWLGQFRKLRQLFQIVGFILSVGVVIGCGFIIANFMGLRHQSRKNEIEIVQLHGASPRFIMAPFLWEGLIEGLLGTAVALVGLYAAKIVLSSVISVQWINLIGVGELAFLSTAQIALVVLIGVAMAFFGSVTVFLRFFEGRS